MTLNLQGLITLLQAYNVRQSFPSKVKFLGFLNYRYISLYRKLHIEVQEQGSPSWRWQGFGIGSNLNWTKRTAQIQNFFFPSTKFISSQTYQMRLNSGHNRLTQYKYQNSCVLSKFCKVSSFLDPTEFGHSIDKFFKQSTPPSAPPKTG